MSVIASSQSFLLNDTYVPHSVIEILCIEYKVKCLKFKLQIGIEIENNKKIE